MVVQASASASRLAGGTFHSIRDLSFAISQAGAFQVRVLALRDCRSDEDLPHWRPLTAQVCPILGPASFGYSFALARCLATINPSLAHAHGLWKYPILAAANWARNAKIPYIVSPHGMLEPWALSQSPFRKKLAGWLYQNRCIRGAACIHATSPMEAESVRLAGFRNPIAVIPNGVELPPKAESRKQKAEIRTVLFLSRIHPKKGLLNLVRAWAIVQGTRPRDHETTGQQTSGRWSVVSGRPSDWRLVIAGPDEKGHLEEVKAEGTRLKIGDHLEFVGPVDGKAKWDLYQSADLFVLPSFSENFGLVIAEALACGVPVITTRATPWEELEQHRCGWWIDTGVEPLVDALKDAMNRPVGELHEMGRRGRALVEAKYTWPPVARQMVEVYQWVLGRGPRPECVV